MTIVVKCVRENKTVSLDIDGTGEIIVDTSKKAENAIEKYLQQLCRSP